MGLLSALKSRFFPPELCRVAKTADAGPTADCLARTFVVVIGADLGESIPLDAEQDAVLRIVEAAAQKKAFDGDLHKYEIEGETFLPVFTDRSAAETFCGAYVSLLGRIHAFRLFQIPGAYIRHWIADQDIIVVNPQSGNEAVIDRDRSRAVREHLPETDGFDDARFLSLALPMTGISQTIEFGPESY